MLFTSFLIAGAVYAAITQHKDTSVKNNRQEADKSDWPILSHQENPVVEATSNSAEDRSLTHFDLESVEQKINRKLIASATALGATLLAASMGLPLLHLLGLAALLYASADFFKDGYQAIFEKHTLNTAVVDAVILIGLLATNNLISGALMCTLLWSAHKILLKTEDHSRQSLVNVFSNQPRSVWVLKEGIEIEIPFEQLQAGDTLMINAGEVIPADGIIVEGTALVDQHALTGESQPAEKAVDDTVFAATLLVSGKLQVQVEKAGRDSTAMQIGEVLLKTADFKTTTQMRWVERVDKTAPVTLGVGALALPVLGPASAMGLLYSFNYGYSMRVIAPATMMNFLNLASHSGILIKDGRSLELLEQVDTVVFDKTGTLTLEQPQFAQVHTCADYDEDTVLTYAAAAEYRQTHPIACAILEVAKARDLPMMSVDNAEYELGYGIKVELEDKTLHVGSIRFMQMLGIELPETMQHTQRQCHDQGSSLIMVAANQQLVGAIELQASIRPEAQAVIDDLRQREIDIYIMSGDHEKPTQHLAQLLDIPHYFSEVLPENKADKVKQLQQEGKKVCFIGDGINDAIALKQADVSISMSGATSIATDTAQIVLMDGSLKQLTHLFELSLYYKNNLNRSFMISLVPSAVTVGGILFLHFGITASILLYFSGLFTGMGNAFLPLSKPDKSNNL